MGYTYPAGKLVVLGLEPIYQAVCHSLTIVELFKGSKVYESTWLWNYLCLMCHSSNTMYQSCCAELCRPMVWLWNLKFMFQNKGLDEKRTICNKWDICWLWAQLLFLMYVLSHNILKFLNPEKPCLLNLSVVQFVSSLFVFGNNLQAKRKRKRVNILEI